MNRKEFIETAISAAKVFGDLHYSAILDAKETVRELGDSVWANGLRFSINTVRLIGSKAQRVC
jgi:hypothetical protein